MKPGQKEIETVSVVATAEGFYKGRRKAGDVFQIEKRFTAGTRKSKWFVLADDYVDPDAPKEDDEPKTLSEVVKKNAKKDKAAVDKKTVE